MRLQRANTVEFSPDGLRLASADAGSVTLWRTADGTREHRFKIRNSSDLAFSPDGGALLVKTTSGRLVVLLLSDPGTQRVLRRAGVEGARPLFTSCGRFIVHGSWDGKLEMLDVDRGTVAWSRQLPGEMITDLQATADRRTW